MSNEVLRMPRILILGLIVSFPAVLAILFTPALPDLAEFFSISESLAKTSMTTYLLGYAIGMLIYGPLANRWGRKTALISGFILALLAIVLSVWAGTMKIFWLFCLMRMMQGLGASSGMKISMTMIADTHIGEKATRAVSYLILAATTVPALGMAIGGMLTAYFGWEGCFVFLAIYCVFLMFLIRLLPETAKELDPNALIVKHIVGGYRKQFEDGFLMRHAMITGLCTSCYFFFTTQGPYIGIESMGLSPIAYGWLYWIPVIGMGSGCIISARLAGRQSPRITMISGLLLALIATLVMLVAFANQYVTIISFFFLMAIVQTGVYVLSPTSLAVALNEATNKSNASAACQFINFGMSFVSVLILSLLTTHHPIILPILLAIAMVIILGLWLSLKAHHERVLK